MEESAYIVLNSFTGIYIWPNKIKRKVFIEKNEDENRPASFRQSIGSSVDYVHKIVIDRLISLYL